MALNIPGSLAAGFGLSAGLGDAFIRGAGAAQSMQLRDIQADVLRQQARTETLLADILQRATRPTKGGKPEGDEKPPAEPLNTADAAARIRAEAGFDPSFTGPVQSLEGAAASEREALLEQERLLGQRISEVSQALSGIGVDLGNERGILEMFRGPEIPIPGRRTSRPGASIISGRMIDAIESGRLGELGEGELEELMAAIEQVRALQSPDLSDPNTFIGPLP